MLIKERLAIPSIEKQSYPIHWWLMLATFVVMAILLGDFAKRNFGLTVSQLAMEIVLVVSIVLFSAALFVIISTLVMRVFGIRLKRGLILAGLAMAPLAVFLICAHFDMSLALAPLKIEFAERAELSNGQERGQSLAEVVAVRDRYLAKHGYIRLGGWRASASESDCSAVYLFAGAF